MQSCSLTTPANVVKKNQGSSTLARGQIRISYPAYSSRSFRLPALPNLHAQLRLRNPEMAYPCTTCHMYRQEEWPEATLFATLPAEVIVQVTKILLMERSVIIYSCDSGLVTAITTAFKSLLSPFTWAGAFVPLLPMNCKEIMQAPVPFLVGVTSIPNICTDISPHASVLHIDDYLSGLSDGRTIGRRKRHLLLPKTKANALMDGDSQIIDIATVSDPSLSSGGQALCSRIRRAAARLRGADKPASSWALTRMSLQSASLQMMTFCMHMTEDQKLALYDLRTAMGNFTREILGDLVGPTDCRYKHPLLDKERRGECHQDVHDEKQEGYSWARYGVMGDEHEHHFIFYPEWFLDQHHQQLRFLTAACNSQYFLTFVDNLRLYEIHRSRCRIFLSQWIWFKLRRSTVRKGLA